LWKKSFSFETNTFWQMSHSAWIGAACFFLVWLRSPSLVGYVIGQSLHTKLGSSRCFTWGRFYEANILKDPLICK
jgi:hypothetical protein